MSNIITVLTSTVVFLFGVFLVVFIISYPTMLLWNECLVPAISGFHEVSWLQMFGIQILISILLQITYKKP